MQTTIDEQRIDGLRRRLRTDPASIAFAQLAEELRRAGQIQESIETCRAGLSIHPTYLSARVTLGRALLETNDLENAQIEMERVLSAAADNLAAIRALGDIHRRRGALEASLQRYQVALDLAPNDPDLEDTVAALRRELAAKAAATAAESAVTAPELPPQPDLAEPTRVEPALPESELAGAAFPPEDSLEMDLPALEAPLAVSFVSEPDDSDDERLARTLVAELENWLDAINVARAVGRA
jgi:tetratricopeptide (TPR) repeat protein